MLLLVLLFNKLINNEVMTENMLLSFDNHVVYKMRWIKKKMHVNFLLLFFC